MGVRAFKSLRIHRALALGLIASTIGLAGSTTPDWLQRKDNPDGRSGYGLVYDIARGHVVLFGGVNEYGYHAETFEWDGKGWKDKTTWMWMSYPPHRSRSAMAYDTVRGRTVLFGGVLGSTIYSDTWEWDGSAWVQRSPATSPPARSRHAMAYDAARGRIVLFGGFAGSTYLSDTWEWDGTTWTQRTPPSSPSARNALAMSYDIARGRVVLFGGYDGTAYRSDTWEWDGSTWIERTPAASPPARASHGMAYDSTRGRAVLFGGNVGSTFLSDTWEWDGSTWTQRSPSMVPPARSNFSMAYDGARSRVMFYGGNSGRYLTDTWEWDGANWVLWETAPKSRAYHAMAYDEARSRLVMFGGYGGFGYLSDTWEWDGADWRQRSPAVIPTARWNHAMAYDGISGHVMLFGGSSVHFGDLLADTWEWDGNAWSQRHPAASPPARTEHAMAYDSARGRVVLFGGGNGPFLTDTWEWDGTTWIDRMTFTGPPGRRRPAMAYDRARGRVVLFGGHGGSGWLNDTWEWDGSVWVQRTPATSPPARTGSAMAYDATRERVVLFGGYGAGLFDDTWEWDGTTWTQRTPPTNPPPRDQAGMAFDTARSRMVLFGGTIENTPYWADTWEYGTISGCAHAGASVAFTPGAGTGSFSAADATGSPDGSAVSLGTGGSAVLRFDAPIVNGPGTDLIVYERGANAGDTNENFRVEAGTDGVTFAFVRDCPGDTCQVDLADAGLAAASYVRVSDLSPEEPDAPPFRGADIDAIASLQCSVPIELCNGIDDDNNGTIPANEIDQDGDGYVACGSWVGTNAGVLGGGDCEDADPTIHPGVQDVCNRRDDDCDGDIDDGATPPSASIQLTATRSGSSVQLAWAEIPGATAYDAVLGDLLALRSGSGNYAASGVACLADDLFAPSTSDFGTVAPGAARWYLVRAFGCGAAASYDEGTASQVASRDAGIRASGFPCP